MSGISSLFSSFLPTVHADSEEKPEDKQAAKVGAGRSSRGLVEAKEECLRSSAGLSRFLLAVGFRPGSEAVRIPYQRAPASATHCARSPPSFLHWVSGFNNPTAFLTSRVQYCRLCILDRCSTPAFVKFNSTPRRSASNLGDTLRLIIRASRIPAVSGGEFGMKSLKVVMTATCAIPPPCSLTEIQTLRIIPCAEINAQRIEFVRSYSSWDAHPGVACGALSTARLSKDDWLLPYSTDRVGFDSPYPSGGKQSPLFLLTSEKRLVKLAAG
ncbi:hypothetical protein DFH06DRAFT_1128684 [Mycena polygramma]|nr:hypothetical protein DFH06DRAFT_1128684 [Mycena polygramma]